MGEEEKVKLKDGEEERDEVDEERGDGVGGEEAGDGRGEGRGEGKGEGKGEEGSARRALEVLHPSMGDITRSISTKR